MAWRAPWPAAVASWSRPRTLAPLPRRCHGSWRRASDPAPGPVYARQFTPSAAAVVFATRLPPVARQTLQIRQSGHATTLKASDASLTARRRQLRDRYFDPLP